MEHFFLFIYPGCSKKMYIVHSLKDYNFSLKKVLIHIYYELYLYSSNYITYSHIYKIIICIYIEYSEKYSVVIFWDTLYVYLHAIQLRFSCDINVVILFPFLIVIFNKSILLYFALVISNHVTIKIQETT